MKNVPPPIPRNGTGPIHIERARRDTWAKPIRAVKILGAILGALAGGAVAVWGASGAFHAKADRAEVDAVKATKAEQVRVDANTARITAAEKDNVRQDAELKSAISEVRETREELRKLMWAVAPRAASRLAPLKPLPEE